MIDSTSSSDRAPRAGAVPPEPLQPNSGRARPGADRLSTDKAQWLQGALATQPEVRPEVVARGKLLAADPGYPPASVISSIAKQILRSPDLSEDPS